MKKVSILSLHLGFGGIEKSVVSLANILCKKYDVEIAVVYKLYDKPCFELNKKVKVKYLLQEVPNRNEFKDSIKNHHYITTLKEGMKSIKILNLRKKKTIKYIKNCDSDVIISTRDIFNEWLGLYARDNVLKIGWEHNHYHDDMSYANKIVQSAKNLDYFVLVSDSLQKFYKNKMVKYNPRCVFIPNVIEDSPSNISNLKSKRLISVGRLSPEKGYFDLLKVFKKISSVDSDWKLDIIGDGDEREKLEKYVIDNNLCSLVTFHGFRNKDYIYDMMMKSSIYLMTSFTESFGIVLLEAMSCGLPCIAFSSAEGANEIINSGYNGYLIKNRNIDIYAKKVINLMNDYDMRVKLSKNARKSINKYKPDIVGEKWFDLIEKR